VERGPVHVRRGRDQEHQVSAEVALLERDLADKRLCVTQSRLELAPR
jgi:hypothetical protein